MHCDLERVVSKMVVDWAQPYLQPQKFPHHSFHLILIGRNMESTTQEAEFDRARSVEREKRNWRCNKRKVKLIQDLASDSSSNR